MRAEVFSRQERISVDLQRYLFFKKGDFGERSFAYVFLCIAYFVKPNMQVYNHN